MENSQSKWIVFKPSHSSSELEQPGSLWDAVDANDSALLAGSGQHRSVRVEFECSQRAVVGNECVHRAQVDGVENVQLQQENTYDDCAYVV